MAKLNAIAFENLRVEMARKQLTITDIANYLGLSKAGLSSKLSMKRNINLNEALCIARTFFPGLSLQYLFKEIAENPISQKQQKGA